MKKTFKFVLSMVLITSAPLWAMEEGSRTGTSIQALATMRSTPKGALDDLLEQALQIGREDGTEEEYSKSHPTSKSPFKKKPAALERPSSKGSFMTLLRGKVTSPLKKNKAHRARNF